MNQPVGSSDTDTSGRRTPGFTLLRGADPGLDQLPSRDPAPVDHGLLRAAQLSIPPDRLSTAMFEHPAHRAAVEYWTAERQRSGGIPAIASFDPLRVRAALGDLMLLEANADGSDFRYRVYGSRIAQYSGFDWTGRLVSELHEPVRSAFLFQYRAACDLQVAIYSEHDAPPQISHVVRWCRLVLPLAATDGRIGRLVVVNVGIRRAA